MLIYFVSYIIGKMGQQPELVTPLLDFVGSHDIVTHENQVLWWLEWALNW